MSDMSYDTQGPAAEPPAPADSPSGPNGGDLGTAADSAAPPEPASRDIKNISGIQGDPGIAAEVDLANEAHAAAKGWQAVKDDTEGELVSPEEPPSQEEIDAAIESANADADVYAMRATSNLESSNPRYAPAVSYLDDANLPAYERLEALEGFSGPPEVEQLAHDLPAYRYFGGDAGPDGRWYTTEWLATPEKRQERLSLPDYNTATEVEKVSIPEGTTVLRGTAAANFGHKGGGDQIYVARPGW